ncbi:hypothetical protein LTR37_018212 [Vermiconidia calcicola]|uniref:Uncharacterized protein n=1 Tax=Vermiconidia calcicola TaxID=1690605 RepID=A0ACC3MHQ3_9PEZI|nr:hypothetical protein LTR37_018212 [Vermiconidia calcicola]
MAYYLYKKIRQKQKQRKDVEPWAETYPLEYQRVTSPNSGGSADQRQREDRTSTKRHDRNRDASSLREDKKAKRKYRWQLIGGLMLPFITYGLNTTMIAGALPFIASDFHQFSQLNWIISAYNLTSAAFIPFWGQLADVFGRYVVLQASMVVFIIGSALCAGSPVSNFPMLLAGRGIEGAGSAGLLILAKVILADKVSLKDNAANNSVFTLVASVGFCIGPIVGGYLTSVSWRWCFIINIPLGLISLALLHIITRPVLLGPQNIGSDQDDSMAGHVSSSAKFSQRLSTIDYVGQVLFLFGMGLFVLALTWAGAYYPWAHVNVLAPLVSGLVLLLVFLAWEYVLLPGRPIAARLPLRRAMIPLKLLWTRNAGLLTYINFITGMAMYAVFYFVNLYFTIVRGFDAGKAGTSLLFYMPGLGGGTILAMFASNVWPRTTWHPLAFGTIIEALGVTLIAAALLWGHLPAIYGMLALTGIGTGVRLMPCTLHGVGYYRKQIASVVTIMNLANAFGGTLASTIMLNIFNNKMGDAGIDLVPGGAESSSASSFSQIEQLPQDVQAFVRSTAKNAIVVAFYGISSFMWLGVVAMSFMGNVNIKKHGEDADTDADGETDFSNLTSGAYIASLFRLRESTEYTAARDQEEGQKREVGV